MTGLETKLRTILNEKETKILPENIKKDVNILGVTGTLEIVTEEDYLVCNTIAKNILGLDDYVPVEYLQSTGTQYIDIPITYDNNTSIEVTMLDVESAEWKEYLSILDDALKIRMHLQKNHQGGIDFFYYTEYISQTWLGLDNKHIYKCEKNKIYIDNVLKHTFTEVEFSFDTAMRLFADSNMQLYNCKVWEGDILVRNLIPVLNSESKGALYDKVSKTYFNNVGDGDFIVGEVVK